MLVKSFKQCKGTAITLSARTGCACFEFVGDNPRCPVHGAKCVHCEQYFVMGRSGVTTFAGPMCDKCANVVRNPLDGTVVSIHPAFAEQEDSLTDMEKA